MIAVGRTGLPVDLTKHWAQMRNFAVARIQALRMLDETSHPTVALGKHSGYEKHYSRRNSFRHLH